MAASPDGAIIAFDYAFLQQRANADQELNDALENGLDRLTHKVPKLVFVPTDQWPEIRKTYLEQHQVGNQNGQEPESTAQDDGQSKDESSPTKAEPVVDKAKELFGDDVIDVKSD